MAVEKRQRLNARIDAGTFGPVGAFYTKLIITDLLGEKMKMRLFGCVAAVLFSAGVGWADPEAIVKAHSDAFQKAFNSCAVPAVLALYEDNATIIWPGEGEVATGKSGIEKIVKADCSGAAKGSLKQVSSESRALGKDYIINIGMWDSTIPGPDGKPMTARVRTMELLHKSGGKWRYAIDNASIGLPPPPAK